MLRARTSWRRPPRRAAEPKTNFLKFRVKTNFDCEPKFCNLERILSKSDQKLTLDFVSTAGIIGCIGCMGTILMGTAGPVLKWFCRSDWDLGAGIARYCGGWNWPPLVGMADVPYGGRCCCCGGGNGGCGGSGGWNWDCCCCWFLPLPRMRISGNAPPDSVFQNEISL